MELRQLTPCMAVLLTAAAFGYGQYGTPPQTTPSPLVLHAERHLVLVDTIVTDKKGDYIRDLTAKDFRLWQDKKEVPIETFSLEADPNSPQARQHYTVLFFDDSTMSAADQVYARKAAGQFLDHNTGPNRLVAVVNFGGSLQLAQNFTSDAERLKQAVNGIKFSAVSPNGDDGSSLAGSQLSHAAAEFGARDVLLAVRALAKGLVTVPGRKTLIFLTSGFVLDSELRSELTAVIDVCNKSNVAVYPIDARGLVAISKTAAPLLPYGESDAHATSGAPAFRFASYLHPAAFALQRGTGGSTGTGGGTRTGGGTTGGGNRGGTTTGSSGTRGTSATNNTLSNSYGRSPFSQPRSIVPPLMPNVAQNQEVLYALASGTGGFVILNTNDLLGGLEKIGNEQNQYYVLGYTPPDEENERDCHELKVKVDRGGTTVRSRSGYCSTKPLDFLAGSRTEKDLEARAQAGAGGNVAASMSLPFFYTSPNTARVDVALEIPPATLKFAKQKGKLHSEMNVLALATEPDGTVAARFSDTVKLEFEDKKELEQFEEHPYHYDKQFEMGAGQYTLKVAFSSGGEKFGSLQMPLAIDKYDNRSFSLSGVAFSKEIHKVSELNLALDDALLEDRTPLLSKGLQFTPTGSHVFDKDQQVAAAYVEIYEPLLLNPSTPKVGLQFKIVDRKTGQQKLDTGFVDVDSYEKPANSVVPVAMKLPIQTLGAGSYRAEFKAADSAGNTTVVRTADFDVQ